MVIKDYSTLKTEMIDYMKAHNTKVTDYNDGSIIVTIFEAIANILEQAYIDTRVGYTNNLKQIATSIFNFSKKEGAYASVSVVFSRNKADTNIVYIPSGTIVSDGTHNFVTTAMGTITAGSTTSDSVSATADTMGTEYNISAGSINSIVSVIDSSVVGVTNALRATGGADDESEADMLARFKTYINGLQGTNYYGLKAGLLSNEKVRSIGIIEHFPPIKDGSNMYNVTVYVDDGTGAMTEELKETLEDLINGDGTSTTPGLRSAGVNIEVLPASQVYINISGTVKIYRTETAQATKDIEETLTTFINGLEIGEDVILSDVILKLRQISYIKDVQDIKIGTQGGTMGTDNITLDESQIARMGTISIVPESM